MVDPETYSLKWCLKMVPKMVFPNIAMAGISPFSIGNTSTQSGAIFQPAMLDDAGV